MTNRARTNRMIHNNMMAAGTKAEREAREFDRSELDIRNYCNAEKVDANGKAVWSKPVAQNKKAKLEMQIADCESRLAIITDDFARKITGESLNKYRAELAAL